MAAIPTLESICTGIVARNPKHFTRLGPMPDSLVQKLFGNASGAVLKRVQLYNPVGSMGKILR